MTRLSEEFERTHGVDPNMDVGVMMHVAQALLVIMGADGEISPKEWEAFEKRARMYGYPEPAIAQLKAFDFRSGKLEEYTESIKKLGYERNVLHDAIVFSRADGIYHPKEHEAVLRLGHLLGLDPRIVEAIEGIVQAEEGLEAARLAILRPLEKKT
jgi:tellurite resistance protein